MNHNIFILLLLIVMTSACSNIANTPSSEHQPALLLEHFFNGNLTAHGIVKNRKGDVIRTFNATIDASWEGDTGVLEEDFIFDDGEKQQRIWTLTKQQRDHYIGTAGDVVGEAKLNLSGNRLFIKYVLQVPYKGRLIDVKVDDRMYLVSPDVLINESLLYKWGFKVGSVSLVILRPSQPKLTHLL